MDDSSGSRKCIIAKGNKTNLILGFVRLPVSTYYENILMRSNTEEKLEPDLSNPNEKLWGGQFLVILLPTKMIKFPMTI